MRIGAINPFSSTPPVARAAPASRIVHDGRAADPTAKDKVLARRRKREPIKPATGPAAAASSATRAALDELPLGG
jgi:hypothetical protein